MAAWMFVTAHVHDRAAFAAGYAPAVARLVAEMGGRYVIRTGAAQVLEGGEAAAWSAGAGMIVIEWPDRATALAFWNSVEYAPIKQLRAGIADVHVILTGE